MMMTTLLFFLFSNLFLSCFGQISVTADQPLWAYGSYITGSYSNANPSSGDFIVLYSSTADIETTEPLWYMSLDYYSSLQTTRQFSTSISASTPAWKVPSDGEGNQYIFYYVQNDRTVANSSLLSVAAPVLWVSCEYTCPSGTHLRTPAQNCYPIADPSNNPDVWYPVCREQIEESGYSAFDTTIGVITNWIGNTCGVSGSFTWFDFFFSFANQTACSTFISSQSQMMATTGTTRKQTQCGCVTMFSTIIEAALNSTLGAALTDSNFCDAAEQFLIQEGTDQFVHCDDFGGSVFTSLCGQVVGEADGLADKALGPLWNPVCNALVQLIDKVTGLDIQTIFQDLQQDVYSLAQKFAGEMCATLTCTSDGGTGCTTTTSSLGKAIPTLVDDAAQIFCEFDSASALVPSIFMATIAFFLLC